MHLRSLALLVVIFGVSAALAGYIGKRYEPVAQHPVQVETPMAVPPAPASSAPVVAAPAPAKPEASVAAPMPAGGTRQPMTLQSAPAAVPSAPENRTPREVAPSPRSTAETAAPAAAEPPRTTGARDTPAPKCNQQACADAYRSFDATDCTYQPANGPRRLCSRR